MNFALKAIINWMILDRSIFKPGNQWTAFPPKLYLLHTVSLYEMRIFIICCIFSLVSNNDTITFVSSLCSSMASSLRARPCLLCANLYLGQNTTQILSTWCSRLNHNSSEPGHCNPFEGSTILSRRSHIRYPAY